MKRLISIDVLRAIAILLMIQVHFVENLSQRKASSAMLYDLSQFLGTLAAPLFTFLLGLSLWLWLRKHTSSGRSELGLSKVAMRRGLFLFGAGLAFAVFIWLPKEVFNWDILTLLGASTFILFWLRKWSPRWLMGLAILVLLISPPLRTASDYASHWRGDEYIYAFTMKDVALGFLLQGYFPVLPWLFFALVGFATGKHYWRADSRDGLTGWRLPIIGLGLVGLAWLGFGLIETGPQELKGYMSDLTFYPASTTYLVGGLGVILVALWVLYRALDSGKASPSEAVLAFFTLYGRYSLTTYIVHHAAHIWPLLLLAAWEGKSQPWWYYGEAVSTQMALILSLIFVVLFYWVLVALDRRKQYSFEETLRWLSEA
jgi:uncharacterized membrane protein